MSSTRRRGFTLIELLVVIAIIAILAAILFPVFGRVKAKAQQVVCLSNLRQLAVAFQMYASEWADTLPPASYMVENREYAWDFSIVSRPDFSGAESLPTISIPSVRFFAVPDSPSRIWTILRKGFVRSE